MHLCHQWKGFGLPLSLEVFFSESEDEAFDSKQVWEGRIHKAKGDLFGQDFKDTLVKKVKASSALSKAVSVVSKSSGSSRKRPSSSHFFPQLVECCVSQGVPAIQQISGERKTDPNKSYFKKTVFSTDSEQINWRGINQTSSRASEDLVTGGESSSTLCRYGSSA